VRERNELDGISILILCAGLYLILWLSFVRLGQTNRTLDAICQAIPECATEGSGGPGGTK
jgi:hypothetical protein